VLQWEVFVPGCGAAWIMATLSSISESSMKSSSRGLLATLALLWSPVARADGGAAHQVEQAPPVKMGTSGGSIGDRNALFCCSGTLGALVLRDGVLCILSNNHVIARSGRATVGEDVLQPGLVDSGCSPTGSNIVGDFAGNLVPLGTANVDAALATARGNVDASGAILDIGVPRTSAQAATVGLSVMKSGRTTGFTTGTVTSTNTTVTVQYTRGCVIGLPFTLTYTNQIATGAMSAGGDSGSLLLSNDGSPNPVGLLYAGSDSTTIYNPIQHVISAFTAGGHTFSFVGGTPLAADDPANRLQRAPAPEDLAQALQAKVENEADLFRDPGVLGVGIGAAADNPFEAAIVIYFDRSRAADIPPFLDGFKTHVIITDTIVAQ
jgi:hypothetical protein